MPKKQEPQQPNTRATQHILDKIKAVQKKIKEDITRLVEMKSKTEELLKKIQDYQRHKLNIKKCKLILQKLKTYTRRSRKKPKLESHMDRRVRE